MSKGELNMNDLLLTEELKIENMIYEVRGKQVMLDSDLALLYQVETKRINEAVRRNFEKFPERFCFKLNKNEYLDILRSQNATLEFKHGQYSKYLPRVFTEQGVAMLATVLKSDVATQVSIAIMDAFVMMRKYISNELIQQKYINNLVIKHDKDIKLLQESFNKFEEKKRDNEIYFNGQIYDAYSKIVDILKEAHDNIIIMDSYADKMVLDMIRTLKVDVTIICKNNGLLKELDVNKYQKQYKNLKVVYNNDFHDRYIILDQKEIYHCGASLNYAGSKTFSINKLEDQIVKDSLIKYVLAVIEKYSIF